MLIICYSLPVACRMMVYSKSICLMQIGLTVTQDMTVFSCFSAGKPQFTISIRIYKYGSDTKFFS